MRFVPKTSRCTDFDAYPKPNNWGKFDASIKLNLHQHLLREQQHLCVYCQQSIPRKSQKDDHAARPPELHPSHIEHIRPKETFPKLTFEHTNLGVSCNGFDIAQSPTAPEFCGHPKGSQFDDLKFLHPFEQTDVELHFEYDINGGIKSSKKDSGRATYTIGLLQLDHQILSDMRAEQYNLVIAEVAAGLDIDDYLDPRQPELPKFFSMLWQLFRLT